eukprot:7177321-Alexandrium_andersonii.AAC.1
MRGSWPETPRCTATRCCKARMLLGRTSRRGPQSTHPRYASLSFAALQPSTLARAGAYRRPRRGSWRKA